MKALGVNKEDQDNGTKLKRISILIWAIGLIAAFFTGQVFADQEKGPIHKNKYPRIFIENLFYDFGNIIQGEKPTAIFGFSNTGSDVLNIEDVFSNNNAITASISDKSLDPGKQGSIKVTLDSTRLFGDVEDEVTLITNDKEQSEVSLGLMAHVQPLLALDPPFIFVGQVTKEGSYSGKAKVWGKLVDEGKTKTLKINASSPSIKAKIKIRRRKNTEIPFLEVFLSPEMKAGSFKEKITIVSEDPPAQTHMFLFGQKLGDIKFTPDKFVFFPRKEMPADSRSVLFECDKPFTITKVEDLSGFLNLPVASLILPLTHIFYPAQ